MKELLYGVGIFAALQALFFAVLLGMAALERRNVASSAARTRPVVPPTPIRSTDDVAPAA